MKRLLILFMALLTMHAAGAKAIRSRMIISNATSKPKLESMVRRIPGVSAASYDTDTHILIVTYDNKKTNMSKIRAAVKKSGYKTGNNNSLGTAGREVSRQQAKSNP